MPVADAKDYQATVQREVEMLRTRAQRRDRASPSSGKPRPMDYAVDH
jgi:hypothetical protein